jgi:hypothetical protein
MRRNEPCRESVLVITLEDFTALSSGSQVPCEGPVCECPRCGRNGVVHDEPNGSLCVHVQESAVLSDGMLTEPLDCCRLPAP